MSESKVYPFLIDLNDGEIVWYGTMRNGAVDGGWGVDKITMSSRTPVKIDFLRSFIEAAAMGLEAVLRPKLEDLADRERAGEQL